MPILQEEWASIQAAIEDSFRKRGTEITQGIVIKRDEEHRQVWLKEFGDDPVHVIGFPSRMYVMQNGSRKEVAIPPTVPKVGETVIVAMVGGYPYAIGIQEAESHPIPLTGMEISTENLSQTLLQMFTGEGTVVYEQPGIPAAGSLGDIWIDTDEVPPQWGTAIPLVTVLPSVPFDGQEIYFQSAAMATDGIVWHLRYRAASASAYKWEFIGGSALYAANDGTVNTSSATVGDGDNPGPSITAPLKGVYDVENFGAGIIFYNAANSELELWLKNGTAAAVRVCSFRTTTANIWGFLHAPRRRITVLADGDVIKMQYAITAAGGSMSASLRAFGLRPVRV